MPNTNSTRTRFRKIYFYIAPAVLVLALFTMYAVNLWHQRSIDIQLADQADLILTKEHRNEARKEILYFEQTWMSWDMQQNPNVYLNKLLTGPLLQYYQSKVNPFGDDIRLIPYGTEVDDLRVVEYSDQSMRVIACITQGTNEVDLYGIVTKENPVRSIINLYLFFRDGDSWKLGSVFDITDPKQALQDWDYLPQNIKDVTGSIESYVYKSCKIGE